MAGPDVARWTTRLEAAPADLDVALAWADEAGDTDLGLAMSAALWRWWLVSGRLAAGRAWLATFLARAGQRRDELAGRALCSAAVLAAENGDYAAAIRQGQQALARVRAARPAGARWHSPPPWSARRTAIWVTAPPPGAASRPRWTCGRRLGDRRGVSVALNNMALLELDDGELDRARELFEQALVIKRQLGEQRSLAIGLANLADVLIRSGQWEPARRALAEAAELAEGIGNPQLIGTLRCSQGNLAAQERDWARAAGHFQAAAAAHRDAGHPHDTVEAMIGLGRAWHQLGRTADALRQLRAAEALAAEIANPQRLAEVRAALAEAGEGAGAAPRRAHRPPGGGAQAARLRPVQQGDRRAALPEPGHGGTAPRDGVPQARGDRAGRGRALRHGPWPGRHVSATGVITPRRGRRGHRSAPAANTWLPGFGALVPAAYKCL